MIFLILDRAENNVALFLEESQDVCRSHGIASSSISRSKMCSCRTNKFLGIQPSPTLCVSHFLQNLQPTVCFNGARKLFDEPPR